MIPQPAPERVFVIVDRNGDMRSYWRERKLAESWAREWEKKWPAYSPYAVTEYVRADLAGEGRE